MWVIADWYIKLVSLGVGLFLVSIHLRLLNPRFWFILKNKIKYGKKK